MENPIDEHEPAIVAAMGYCIDRTAKYDESHDWHHHKRVVELVKIIAVSEEISVFLQILLIIAAWLHDILDHKYVEDLETARQDMIEYLEFLSISPGYIDRIMSWIMNSSWSKEKKGDPDVLNVLNSDLCARILADADRLDSISWEPSPNPSMPMGIYRCYKYSQMRNPTATEAELIQMVNQHCEEKLLILHEWIFTATGKALAQKGTAAIRDWYDKN